ncbi:pirin family protein [Azospirillum halopraeferens]|uniref:pirin family protein n=1 Tax=Azospirillum halopraeferens TaxID=34010 RepID=UPI000420E77C|nr:pirin family protein [Azospirillum halopraeferens]
MHTTASGPIVVRRAADRGLADFGWLDSRHSFSFGHYHDSRHMGFGALRVINEDRVAPGAGFDTHSHRDMEIISYVLDGALEHRDNLGTGSVIRPGDVQRMSAGTGIAHSEFNHAPDAPVHFLQIWIIPERRGLEPGYEQKTFPAAERRGTARLVASRDGRDGSLTVHADADLYASLLAPGDTVALDLRPGRRAWVQVARGTVTLNGVDLGPGDGAAVTGTARLDLTGTGDGGEVLIFDLA